jgi:hypothetical protein
MSWERGHKSKPGPTIRGVGLDGQLKKKRHDVTSPMNAQKYAKKNEE